MPTRGDLWYLSLILAAVSLVVLKNRTMFCFHVEQSFQPTKCDQCKEVFRSNISPRQDCENIECSEYYIHQYHGEDEDLRIPFESKDWLLSAIVGSNNKHRGYELVRLSHFQCCYLEHDSLWLTESIWSVWRMFENDMRICCIATSNVFKLIWLASCARRELSRLMRLFSHPVYNSICSI